MTITAEHTPGADNAPLGSPRRDTVARAAAEPPALLSILGLAGAAATLGALWPILAGGDEPVIAADVIYRLTGGSFVAAGLVAWQRRPANRVGALMVVTG